MATHYLININYVVASSSVLAIVLIAIAGMDILFLNSMTKTGVLQECLQCDYLMIIQGLKIVVLIAFLVNNILFMIGVRKVSRKLLMTTMLANFVLRVFRNILIWMNISMRMDNTDTLSVWVQFEIHPLGLLFFSFWASATFTAMLVWFLGFGWKHKIIRATDKVFKIKIRIFLYIQVIFLFLHAIPFAVDRIRLILNDEMRNKIVSEDPSHFATLAIVLGFGNLTAFWYFYDVILGLRKNSYQRLRRFYQVALYGSPLYQPMQLLLSVQEKQIFGYSSNAGLKKYLIMSLLPGYVLLLYITLFVYYKHLKHNQAKTDASQFSVRMISRRHIKVENKTPIGRGNSSVVYVGKLQKSKLFGFSIKEKAVAIKVLSGYNVDDSRVVATISEELRNMARVMRQSEMPHLVTFYGCCFQDKDAMIPPLGAVNIVMEFCEKGSLDQYLVKMSKELMVNGGELSHQCFLQLTTWAVQVAQGLEFLAKQNIIHGDLAARNILLDATLTAKISDFGMSRKMYDYQIYVSTQQAVFPWRWMAPESLDGLKFSTASDVWSYGVLLWELFSFGTSPWSDKDWSSDFVGCLIAGERLRKPVFAPNFVYNKIMLECWKIKADDRPTFPEILKLLAVTHKRK